MNAVTNILDLRSRCIQARHFRKEGDNDKANAIEPSLEEIREGLIAMRQNRETATATKTKTSTERAAIPLDLNDLFTKKEPSK